MSYGYWDVTPDIDPLAPDSTCLFEVHRRGAVIFGALHGFFRAFREAGFGFATPGSYAYDAQKELKKQYDDERVFLDALLARLAVSSVTKRHKQLAQIAFQKKNVFTANASPSCEGCTAAEAKELAMRTLAIASPFMYESTGDGWGPAFEMFMPQGSIYQQEITLEFSDNPQFKNGGGSITKQYKLSGLPPIQNNAPPGAFWFPTIPPLIWEPVEDKALTNAKARVYYRLIQCQQGDVNCIATATGSDTAPYVRVDKENIASCTITRANRGGEGFSAAVFGLALLFVLRRAGRREAIQP